MNRKSSYYILITSVVSLLAMNFWLSTPARGATITIVNTDSAGEGLNDSTPVSPVGGNTGTTLGQQRLNVFQQAAQNWGATLVSSVTIPVEAGFDALSCTDTSAVLGSAGPTSAHRDFPGAPRANTWYVPALANALKGSDLNTSLNDISARFNSNLGKTGCLTGTPWYYGLDHNAPSGTIDFYEVVMHEMGHGLGFLTYIDSDGSKALGYDDIFMTFLENHSTGKTFPAMTNAERAAAMVDDGDLHWVGANVVNAGNYLSTGRHSSGHVQMYAPNPYESGSSVSHWDTDLTPNELMEPSYTGGATNTLTKAAFKDMGWTLSDSASSQDDMGTGGDAYDAYGANDNATTLARNASGTGEIAFSDDEYDQYKIPVKNGDVVSATFTPPSGSTSIDLLFTNTNKTNTITYNDVTSSSTKSITASGDGYIYLTIDADTASDTGTYSLSISIPQNDMGTGGDAYDAYAASNSATTLARNASGKGEIAYPGDEYDQYKVPVNTGENVYVTFTPPAGATGLDLLIRDTDGSTAKSQDNVTSEITHRVTAGGNGYIYIIIDADNSTDSGIYELSLTISPAGSPLPVYRFYGTVSGSHFFTIREAEKDSIISNNPAWRYEGIAWYCYTTQKTNTIPVFRFYGTVSGSHFFTKSAAEKDYIIANNPAWRYEGVAWYAFSAPVTNSRTVYRFYGTVSKSHFFTINQAEKDYIIANNPAWRYEGEAWHAYTSATAALLYNANVLYLQKSGEGEGTIVAGGHICGPDCELIELPYVEGTSTSVQVIPAEGSSFTHWQTATGVPLESIYYAQPGEVVLAVFDK